MSKSAHTEAHIIGAIKQVDAGRKADEVARAGMGVSKQTIYAVLRSTATSNFPRSITGGSCMLNLHIRHRFRHERLAKLQVA